MPFAILDRSPKSICLGVAAGLDLVAAARALLVEARLRAEDLADDFLAMVALLLSR
jgi:hypothetical protein